jgi:hypothetical protein
MTSGLALRWVTSLQRRFVIANVVRNGEQLEGGERAEYDVHVIALDDLLRLVLGTGRATASVGRDQLDLAARERVVLLLQKGCDALLQLDAALRERTGFDGQQTDLECRGLCDRGRRDTDSCRGRAGCGPRQEGPPVKPARHIFSSLLAVSASAYRVPLWTSRHQS